MPTVKGKKYPYTTAGRRAAKAAADREAMRKPAPKPRRR
jgi:hypothetical protein